MTGHLALRTVLGELGGVATSADLRAQVSARSLRTAVADETVIHLSRGRYASPGVADHLQRAHRIGGTVSHLSAAAQHGWSLKRPPTLPHVTIGRHRHLSPADRRGSRVFWRQLPAELIVNGVTEPYRTVLDCARDLPFDEALAITDSALRCGHIDLATLRQHAGEARGQGAPAIRRVAREADQEAANPLESVLRAIGCDVAGLHLTAQFQIQEPYARVDLGDPDLRIVVEAEGFETHATRAGFDKDCARYTQLTCHGYLVLRFTYQQVMRDPRWVTGQLDAAVALARSRLNGRPGRKAAPGGARSAP